jgi:hypothetical protein
VTRPEEYPFLLSSFTGKRLQWRSSASVALHRTKISSSLHTGVASTRDEPVTLPMLREAPSNFGVKLPRPGFGPAAELPASPPA